MWRVKQGTRKYDAFTYRIFEYLQIGLEVPIVIKLS